MTKAVKRQQLIEKAKLLSKGVEVQLNPDTYRSDLIKALNYYNASHDDKEKKKWFIAHVAREDKKLATQFLKLDEFHFRYAGILARIQDGGSDLEEKELNYFQERIKFLKELLVKDKPAPTKVEVVDVTPVVSIQQRMEEKAHDLAGEIEGAIDDFVLNGCKSDFSTKNYLLANQVAGPIAKRIGELFQGTAKELREAIEGNDEQLVEGYSHFNKRELKKFAEFVETIISDCEQQVQTAKASRSPRKRKPVPLSKQVARVKYMREFAELKLKSCKAEDIIGSSELWVYNTKYRKLQVYKVDTGGLAVKGTTVIGFSVTESKSLTLRKPEEFFKGLSLGKRALNSAIKTITTKPTKPNGRINEECILLGAF